MLIYFFFFFQAEDGIRDRDVTGVQTCALPISSTAGCTKSNGPDDAVTGPACFERSEERRVGKGVDLGGRRIIKKKKEKKKKNGHNKHNQLRIKDHNQTERKEV